MFGQQLATTRDLKVGCPSERPVLATAKNFLGSELFSGSGKFFLRLRCQGLSLAKGPLGCRSGTNERELFEAGESGSLAGLWKGGLFPAPFAVMCSVRRNGLEI